MDLNRTVCGFQSELDAAADGVAIAGGPLEFDEEKTVGPVSESVLKNAKSRGRAIGGDETCDDGNTDNGDGCDSDCQVEALAAVDDQGFALDAYGDEIVLDVLENDCCGVELRIIEVTDPDPNLALVSISDEGSLVYNPNENDEPPYQFSVGDTVITFSYTIINEFEALAEAEVTVTVSREEICGDNVPEGGEVCDGNNCKIDCSACEDGYDLDASNNCIDIDECVEGIDGCVYGDCVNTDGSYSCECSNGITGNLCDEAEDTITITVDAGGLTELTSYCAATSDPCCQGTDACNFKLTGGTVTIHPGACGKYLIVVSAHFSSLFFSNTVF